MEYVPDQVTLWNQTREGMAIVAEEGTILRANPALCEFLGYSETELLDMTFMDVTASTDLRADLAEYDKLIRREIDSYTMSKLYRTKSGRLRPGKLRAYRLPGADKILILGQVLPTDPFEAAGVPSDHQAEVMTMAVSQLLVAGAKNWKVVLAIVAILTGLKLDTLIELLSK